MKIDTSLIKAALFDIRETLKQLEQLSDRLMELMYFYGTDE